MSIRLENKHRFWASLLALGISSVAVQLVMIREVMASFSGNELVIGLVLGAWLLFTGLGTALGARLPARLQARTTLLWGHTLVALLPFAQIGAIRVLPFLWTRGVMLGLGKSVLPSGAVILPFCVIGGAMIPVAARLLRGEDVPGKVYFVDSLGDLTGGVLFSVVFVYALSHWDSLLCVALLNLSAAALMTGTRGRLLAAIVAMGLLVSRPLDRTTIAWRFPGQTVILHKNTPFAQLTISRSGTQINVLQDAIPLFSSHEPEIEAKVHPAMAQAPRGAKVLLIAGGVFGTINEIAKHRLARVDYVEIDPAVVALDDLLEKSLSHPFVHVHVGDGRLFVRQTRFRYDVVIVDLPDPENTQLNRFYSQEFFREVKSILSPGGVLAFSLVGAENYLEDMGLAVNRCVYSALKSVFRDVRVFPGLTHYYLASDRPLTLRIGAVLSERGISTDYLVDYALPTMTDPFRMKQLHDLLEQKTAPPNQDLSPVAFGHLLDMWLKKTGSTKALLMVSAAGFLLFAGLSCRQGLIPFTVMSSGYAAMAFELALLLLFQVIYGYVYLRMCLLITLFMAGAALGALCSAKIRMPARRQMTGCDLVLVAVAGTAWGISRAGVGWKGSFGLFSMQYGVIPLLIFMAAFVSGAQFCAATKVFPDIEARITGRLYTADLAGAACGTILTGLLFLPRIGITGVLVSVLAVKSVSLILNLRAAGRPEP